MAKKASKKAAPVEEVEDDEEVELEELDDEVDEDDDDEAPKSKKSTKKADDDIWGVQDLIKLIKKETGREYKPREVRALLRRMARDGKGRIDREIVAGNKSRYSWSGPDHPEVKAVLKAVKKNEIEDAKKEALDKLKADKAAKDAKATKSGKKGKKGKKAPKPPVDDDDDDESDEDDED